MLQRLLGLLFISALALGSVACGKPLVTFEELKACGVADDQLGSFFVPLDRLGTRVIVDSRFNSGEYAAIEQGIAKWNRFLVSQGSTQEFFFTERGEVPMDLRTKDPSECGGELGESDAFYVVREADRVRWRAIGQPDQVPGVTIRCSYGNSLVRQVVWLDPEHVGKTQFQSVAVHELGHAVGLDHSCSDKSDSPNHVSCLSSRVRKDYSVMYPYLVGTGYKTPLQMADLKDTLRDNDRLRAACLYRLR